MGRQEHDAGQARQVPLEELRRGVVEVIGGFVQQQCPRSGHQQGGQRQPAPLPSGQLGQRPSRGDAAEPEPLGHHRGAAIRVPHPVCLGPLQHPPVLVEHGRVVRPPFEPGGEGVELLGRTPEVGERVVEDVGRRGGGRVRQFLVQEADVTTAGDGARLRAFEPGQQPQQGGLAHAVVADQPDSSSRTHGEVESVEHHAVAVGERHVAGVQRKGRGHGTPPAGVAGHPPGGTPRTRVRARVSSS